MDIEWEELQAAVLSRDTERVHYLDRESGEVVAVSEGDGEEEDGEDEGPDGGEDLERLRAEIENDPDRFVAIDPVPPSDRLEWMIAFIQTVGERELSGRLRKAVDAQQPERDFERVLRAHPEARARWLGYLDAQAQEVIDGWVEENDIESDTPPPWKVMVARRKSKKSKKA